MTTFIGTDGNDNFTGSAGDDLMHGNNGNDTLNGAGGNDTLFGDVGNDILNGGSGDDTLSGGFGFDTLVGGEGNDVLDGALDSDLDSDVMAGGVGDDIYYADADDTIQEGLNEGIDKIFTAQSAILPDGVENLTLTGTQDVNGTGNELDNVIFGNSGQNRLSDGSGGFDVLVGGAGNDIYDVTRGTTVIVEESGAGRDLVYTSVSYVLPDFVEDASTSVLWEAIDLTGNELSNGLIGNYGNNTLSGLGGNDRLNGGPGDDTLIGGAGSDQLAGGGGIDTADYSSAPGAIFLNIDAPTDDVFSTVTGAAGRDTLSLIEHIIGSSFDDVLRLYGKVMTRLDGGAGDDTVTGNSRADVLNGGSGNDIISGGAANDTLIGGAGNDTMDGGSGVDLADYSEATTRVTVDLAFSGPQNTGNGTGFDTLSNIENLTGGRLTDRLSGNGLDNVLKGLNGNDWLEGGAGNDVLVGGSGDDLLIGGAGIDTADYADSPRAVSVNLSIATAQDTKYGSDTLSGIENVTGSAYNDRLVGSTTANVMRGGAGNDTLSGIGGSDTLFGDAGDDNIAGGAGNDLLIGGAGADELLGGADADSFVFTSVADSLLGVAARDTIDDFQQGADHIDLSAIDANLLVAGDQAFSFIGGAAFTHAAAQLRQAGDGLGNTIVMGDIEGDGLADFHILLKGAYTLTGSDFVL